MEIIIKTVLTGKVAIEFMDKMDENLKRRRSIDFTKQSDDMKNILSKASRK